MTRLIIKRAEAIKITLLDEIEYLFIPTIIIEIIIIENTITISKINPMKRVETPTSTGILNFLFKT